MTTLTIAYEWLPTQHSDGTLQVAKDEIQEYVRLLSLSNVMIEHAGNLIFHVTGTYSDLEKFVTGDYTYQCTVEEYLI